MTGADLLGEQVIDAMHLHLGVQAGGHFDDEVPIVVASHWFGEPVLEFDDLVAGAERGDGAGDAFVIRSHEGSAKDVVDLGDIGLDFGPETVGIIGGVEDGFFHATVPFEGNAGHGHDSQFGGEVFEAFVVAFDDGWREAGFVGIPLGL